jgi:hypothetical protein
MIELLDRLEPAAKIGWATYTIPAQIDWLHSDKRVLGNVDQIYPSSGPGTISPTALFSVEIISWESTGW